jgi:hypothetical protein
MKIKQTRQLTMLAMIALLFNLSVAEAQYADEFLSETEHYGSYASEIKRTREKADDSLNYKGARAELPVIEETLKKQDNFSGPIERLLKAAGENPAAANNNWKDFESIEDNQQAKEKYYNSPEWKVRDELSKPVYRRSAFGDRLGELEQTIVNIKPKKSDLEKEYGQKSKWAPAK